MEKLQVKVEVSKEAHELMEGLVKFSGAMKSALADGWDAGMDIPAIMDSAIGDLVPALQGVEKLADESKEDPQAFYAALLLGAKDLSSLFLKKTSDVVPV